MSTPRAESHEPARLRWPVIAAAALVSLAVAIAFGYLGAATLNFRALLYGPHFRAARYSDYRGAFLELFEVLTAMAAAGIIGFRVSWLSASAICLLIWKRGLRLGRAGWVDLLLIPVLCIWGYLIYVSWGPTWK